MSRGATAEKDLDRTPTLLRVVEDRTIRRGTRAIDFDRRRARVPKTQRMMAAIMFVDMVGYSAQMQDDEEATYSLRMRYRHVLSVVARMYRGDVVQHYGDGALVIYRSPVDAVRAAIEIQRRLREEPPLNVRIGVHVADIVRDSMGVYGDGVNVTARIQGLCPPGGVLVSEQVQRELANHRGLETKPMGAFHLKNIRRPMAVYGLRHPELAEVSSRRLDQRRPVYGPDSWVLIMALGLAALAGFLAGVGL